MKFNDIIIYAFKNIGFKGLRSWLTILGIIIGIAAVVGLMTYSQSISAAINTQFSTFGSTTMTVTPGAQTRATQMSLNSRAPPSGGFSPGAGFSRSETSSSVSYLTTNDAEVLAGISGIEAVSPLISERLRVEYDSKNATLSATFVIPSQYQLVNSLNISEGNFISDGGGREVVIGFSLSNNTFDSVIKIGDELIIGDAGAFRVVGILGQAGFGSSDNGLFLTMNEAPSLVSNWTTYEYSSIQVKAVSTGVIDNLTIAITQALDTSRGLNSGEEDFQVSSPTSMINSINSVLSTLSLFFLGVAAISLLVGAISIANTMFTSVFEKTRDIGIMKALGANDSDIQGLFITESAMISLVGGLGGIIVGLFLAQGLVSLSSGFGVSLPMTGGSGDSGLSLVISPELIAFSLLISLIIGVISGYLPARKAGNMNPIEAIWYE